MDREERGDPSELSLEVAVMVRPQGPPQTPSLHPCPRQVQRKPEAKCQYVCVSPGPQPSAAARPQCFLSF